MAISNQTVIKKMINELQQASLREQSGEKLREHVRAVRLLCDLILEEDSAPIQASSDQELQKMIGELGSAPGKQATLKKQPGISTNKETDEEANGSSIFDF